MVTDSVTPVDTVLNAEYRRLHQKMVAVLQAQADLVDQALHILHTGNDIDDPEVLKTSKSTLDVILAMVQGLGVSLRSIIKLNDELSMSVRDCYGIARSISEGAINVAYICAGGADIANLATRHALQKQYRDLDRKWEVGDVNLSVGRTGPLPDPSRIPGLTEALAEFTRKNGGERTSWTNDDLETRIVAIGKRFPKANINFAGASFGIYRHSSEILHGTYFGIIYFWTGGTHFRISRESVEYLLLANHFTAVFGSTFFALHGLVEVLRVNFGASTLQTLNADLLRRATEVIGQDLMALNVPGNAEPPQTV